MQAYLLSEINEIVNGSLLNKDNSVNKVFIDSRFPILEKSLFFAIEGKQNNGHDFIEDLYSSGVRNFVVNTSFDVSVFKEASFIKVRNTLDALQNLASDYRSKLKQVVAITGSAGKTTVKEWLTQCLAQKYKVARSPKSYNSQVGVPLSLLMADVSEDIVIMEAGISHKGEMKKLEKMLSPEVGILTNIGNQHQENFSDLQEKLAEKLSLFKNSDCLIYNGDDEFICKFIKENDYKFKPFTWGRSPENDVYIKDFYKEENVTRLGLIYDNKYYNLHLPFILHDLVSDALHCVSFMFREGIEVEYIQKLISELSEMNMRSELLNAINSCSLVNINYNFDPNSVAIDVDNFISLSTQRKKTIILTDISNSKEGDYEKLAKTIQSKGIDTIIGIGAEIEKHSDLFSITKHFYVSVNDFLNTHSKSWFNQEDILLLTNESFQQDLIIQFLEHKIHQTVLEVNMSALVHNFNYYKSRLKKGVKIMAMIKAGAYGAGMQEIASLLQFHKADYLAVAYADEGILLRNAGITMPIVILNPEPDSYSAMINYNLEPEIYSFYSLQGFFESAKAKNTNDYPIHIKLDTGMHRLGFIDSELDSLLDKLNKQSYAKVQSIFSHLAAADEFKHNDFTLSQIEKFDAWSSKIVGNLNQKEKPLRHILNTPGQNNYIDNQFDMVRLGIGLYGVGTDEESAKKLMTVSTLTSSIVQIRDVVADETVGYGRKGIVEGAKRIAIVPIGYADGLNRRLSCGVGYFMVKGKKAPIIGNICMDTCMIDITGINVKEGEKVIIFGEQPTVTELANKLGTIPYEILTGISQRVKRVYYTE